MQTQASTSSAAASPSTERSSVPVRQTRHHQIAIVGGGAAGLTVAAQLIRADDSLDIAILEPSDKHYYQPGWTLVAGGIFRFEDTVRDEKSYIPPGTTWIRDAVADLDPDNNALVTCEGIRVTYDFLVVCPGIQIDWHKVAGLPEALGKDGVTSNYSHAHTKYTWELLRNFDGGNAIFTYPSTPLKCGGAPQKIMYLADDVFRSKWGVRDRTEVIFCTPANSLFSVPEYTEILKKVVAERDITVKFGHTLVAIDADRKEAVFQTTDSDGNAGEARIPYNFIHAVPPMSAPDFIKGSPLAVPDSPGGWVDVDKHSLQHRRYPNVFSIGDASSLPTSKTAAAIRRQAPVLVEHLLATLRSGRGSSRYDGYTCCPLITGYDKAIMAEFDYDRKPVSSFPTNPVKERWSMWTIKCYALPWLYWNRMLKGAPFEGDMMKSLQWKRPS